MMNEVDILSRFVLAFCEVSRLMKEDSSFGDPSRLVSFYVGANIFDNANILSIPILRYETRLLAVPRHNNFARCCVSNHKA